ncbi:MAG: TIGR03085 family metal-binding protein [Actinobacteria bacterium]|nr:TIGR03085 family metal-binding protein [Actinomycetota bacterium]
MGSYARMERYGLCDLFDQVGPRAPTLCTGWDTADLAAHLVIRENRPDAVPGIVLPPFAGYTSRIQHKVASRPFDEVVEMIRRGPPRWSPYYLRPLDEAINTVEYFIHNEDVRRARPDWQPRELDQNLERILWSRFRQLKWLLFRKAGVSLRVEPDGFPAIGDGNGLGGGNGPGHVTISGKPSELLIFATGRKKDALIEIHGSDDAVAALMNVPAGI